MSYEVTKDPVAKLTIERLALEVNRLRRELEVGALAMSLEQKRHAKARKRVGELEAERDRLRRRIHRMGIARTGRLPGMDTPELS